MCVTCDKPETNDVYSLRPEIALFHGYDKQIYFVLYQIEAYVPIDVCSVSIHSRDVRVNVLPILDPGICLFNYFYVHRITRSG